MKKLTYEYDEMKRAASLIDKVEVTGIQNFRLLAEVANILDSGHLFEDTEAGKIEYKRGAPPRSKKEEKKSLKKKGVKESVPK